MKKATFSIEAPHNQPAVTPALSETAAGFVAPMSAPVGWVDGVVVDAVGTPPAWMTDAGNDAHGVVVQANILADSSFSLNFT